MKHLGWKAMAANLSDIAAMGGIPRYATVMLSLPQKISVEMVEEFYSGIAFACKKYSCLLVGGDTTNSLSNMTVAVTLIGEAIEQKIIYRTGAKPGDYLCVTGHLGASLAGLKVLQREKQRYASFAGSEDFQPNLQLYTSVIEKHLMPKPRLDISKILTENVRVNAMIDISDGLASEVYHLCEAGGVGAVVYEHNLPVDIVTQTVASEFSDNITDYALYGGEEYELLFSISKEEYANLEPLTNDVTIVGKIIEKEKGVELVRENGEHEDLHAGGWNHFKP
jgi:thiamine-monophosphate kinase